MAGTKKSETGMSRPAERLAALITEVRAETGETDKAIAKKLGVTQAHVTNLRNRAAKIHDVRASLIEQACEIWQVDPHYFFDKYEGVRSYKRYLSDKVRALEARVERLERGGKSPVH